MADQKKNKETILDELIHELSSNRPKLYDMLQTIKKFRDNIEIFIPADFKDDKRDFRKKDYNKFMMQENMKHVTDILKAELDVHKAIEGSIKTEYELRNKIADEEEVVLDGSFEYIRKALKDLPADQLEQMTDAVKVVSKEK